MNLLVSAGDHLEPMLAVPMNIVNSIMQPHPLRARAAVPMNIVTHHAA